MSIKKKGKMGQSEVLEKREEKGSEMVRVYGVSDLHVDHSSNMKIVKEWREKKREGEGETVKEVLLLGGDVSSELSLLEEALTCAKQSFSRVFFVVGNNEMRLTRRDKKEFKFSNSFQKFEHILKLCEKLGVETKPAMLSEKLFILPLFSWYSPFFHNKFKSEGDVSLGTK